MHEHYGTWSWVAIAVKDKTGQKFDRALLSRIAAGTQKAPPSVRRALGLVKPRRNVRRIVMAALGLPWA